MTEEKPLIKLDVPDLQTIANGGLVRDERTYIGEAHAIANCVVPEDAPPCTVVDPSEIDDLNEGKVLEKRDARIKLVSGLQGDLRKDWTLAPPEE